MTTPEAQDAAAKERIIKHMNGDHQDSVCKRYGLFRVLYHEALP
jgi:hypothetical protein